MKKLDYQWEMTEENFHNMMAERMSDEPYGSLRVGRLMVMFRSGGAGHAPYTDILVHGKTGNDGCTTEYLDDGTPYLLLLDDIDVPKRRTMAKFMLEFEVYVSAWLCGDGKRWMNDALEKTLPAGAWNPGKPSGTIRIGTSIGTLIAEEVESDEYPGFRMLLERNGKPFEIALVEVDQSTWLNAPELKAHIWSSNPDVDEPVFDINMTADEIDSFQKERCGL